jgi:hypothetical protein
MVVKTFSGSLLRRHEMRSLLASILGITKENAVPSSLSVI